MTAYRSFSVGRLERGEGKWQGADALKKVNVLCGTLQEEVGALGGKPGLGAVHLEQHHLHFVLLVNITCESIFMFWKFLICVDYLQS